MCGMLIFTGHAAWQAPHKEEACGRCGFALTLSYSGVRMLPIGPE